MLRTLSQSQFAHFPMLFRRVSRNTCTGNEMVAKFCEHILFSPFVCAASGNARSISFMLPRVRCFQSSSCKHDAGVSVHVSTQSSVLLSANRISRVARTDAQAVLFDYLHSTRGFQFIDAEHISKNSPHFLQDLLAQVENEEDVSRALSKFFRYNPINEFEPFLESLGLTPSEVRSLLPPDLIFLCDDQVLLDNFHVICDYGIPRIKIGKIYKEAYAIFKNESGTLFSKLKAFEELGLSRSTVIKLVICCPTLLVGDISDFMLVLKKLKELGFGNDWIGDYLSDTKIYNWNRIIHTMQFLNEVGYSETQMGVLFNRHPSLLFEGSGKRIYTLVGRLLKLGIKMNFVYSLVLENPQILSPKCFKNLWKALHFLLEIGMETEDIANIVLNHVELLASHSLKGPKTVLKNYKGDKVRLCQTIKEDPLKLLSLASKLNCKSTELSSNSKKPDTALEKRAFLLRLGYVENSDEMLKAYKQFRGRADQLQERFDCLVEAGLDCNVVSSMIRQAPTVLNQSESVLKMKIDCLRNVLGYPLESIIKFPSYLCYDMERINLRFSMYVWLREREAVKMVSVSTLLACSDTRFIKYFVDVHSGGPAKWEELKKSLQS